MSNSTTDFIWGVSYQQAYQGITSVLSPLLQEVQQERLQQIGLDSDISMWWFTPMQVVNPFAKVMSLMGPQALTLTPEGSVIPTGEIQTGYEKGYQLDKFAKVYPITNEFTRWAQVNKGLTGADSSVRAALDMIRMPMQYITDGAKLQKQMLIAKVFAQGGVSTSAYGPWSASPDGQPLFSTAHPIKGTGGTFSNRMASGKLLTAATLQEALNKFKTEILTNNGNFLIESKKYKLMVPRLLATTARSILNSTGNQVNVLAGTGSNAALVNTFAFEGNTIELVEIPYFGSYDDKGVFISPDGTQATAQKCWFLVHEDLANGPIMPFRLLTLQDITTNFWYDQKTDVFNLSGVMMMNADFFEARQIVGYLGD